MAPRVIPRRPDAPPLVYVSGPYRDKRGTYYVEQNIRLAELVARELWAMGFAAICPHANTRHFDGYAGLPPETWIRGDLVMVERSDAVVVLPDWQHSQGTLVEIEHALLSGVPVYYWPRDLRRLRQELRPPNPTGTPDAPRVDAPSGNGHRNGVLKPRPTDLDAAAAEILDCFDFEAAALDMRTRHHTWSGKGGAVHPSGEDLEELAEQLLREVVERRPKARWLGGLVAVCLEGHLSLHYAPVSCEALGGEAWQQPRRDSDAAPAA